MSERVGEREGVRDREREGERERSERERGGRKRREGDTHTYTHRGERKRREEEGIYLLTGALSWLPRHGKTGLSGKYFRIRPTM